MVNANFLGLIIMIQVLSGLFFRNTTILSLSFPFVIYLLWGVMKKPRIGDISISRQLSQERITVGDEINVTISVKNNSENLIEEVFVKDILPGDFDITDGQPNIFTTLAPQAEVIFIYKIRPTRGFHNFEKVRCKVNENFDIGIESDHIICKNNLLVLPNIKKIRNIPVQLKKALVMPGLNLARIGGTGTQFFDTREYQTGDSLRHLNWKILARRPESYFTNIFEQERVAEIALFLDARVKCYNSEFGIDCFEKCVEAVAYLSDTYLSYGNKVGLLIYGDTFNWTSPGFGKFQKERILQSLSKARLGKHELFKKMDEIPVRIFPSRSQVIMITPLQKKDIDSIVRLRAKGYELLLIVPDVISPEIVKYKNHPGFDLIKRLSKLERQSISQELENKGIFVIKWDHNQTFSQVINRNIYKVKIWNRSRS